MCMCYKLFIYTKKTQNGCTLIATHSCVCVCLVLDGFVLTDKIVLLSFKKNHRLSISFF